MSIDAVREGSPGVVGVQPVEATDIGSGIGNTLGLGVEDNTGDEATTTIGLDILPRESGLGGSCSSRKQQLDGRNCLHDDQRYRYVPINDVLGFLG